MTGLRRTRKMAQTLIIALLTWEAVGAVVGLGCLIVVAINNGGLPPAEQMISVVATLSLGGVVVWAIRDAGHRTRR